MKGKTYKLPAMHTVVSCGYARLIIELPTKSDPESFEDAVRVLCKKVRDCIDDDSLEDQIEFVTDAELSFRELQGEETIERVCQHDDAPFDLLDYDEVRAAGGSAGFFNAD